MGKNKKSNFDGIVSFDMPIHIKMTTKKIYQFMGCYSTKKRDMEMTFGHGSWGDFYVICRGLKGFRTMVEVSLRKCFTPPQAE